MTALQPTGPLAVGPVRRGFRGITKVTALITIAGVAAIGQDAGWWGKETLSCQAPGAETTASDARFVTAATVGERQGQWLRRLTGPPPSQKDMNAVADKAAEAVVVYALSLRDAARDREQSERVRKYNAKRKVAKERQLAQRISLCSPCPQYQPDGQVLTVAARELTAEQAGHAATIKAVGARMGVPAQGQVVAVAAALQESGLRNLPYGDRDSVGLFQQRAGWGTVAQRMRPQTAATGFYRALLKVPGWQSMTVTQAAQAVQRSAYPGAYAKWEAQARAIVGTGAVVQAASAVPVGADSFTCTAAPGGASVDNAAWKATHENGRIPATELAHPASAPTHLFRPDAAEAFDRLNAAYRARFGVSITVTDSYRDYAGQVRAKATKGHLAAEPGTSNHGWGIAADLAGGLQSYGTAPYAWMRANAPRFGWDNPTWARPGGSKNEPWHWEFVGGTAA